MASVSIGRNRLPPDSIRCLAISGIIVTSDPVRDRMVVLTRSMSAATSLISWAIEGEDGLSKGTMTAKAGAPHGGTRAHRNAMVEGQVRKLSENCRPRACRGAKSLIDVQ